MNYTVAPFELADVKAPCSWSVYVDMFNVWRQCLSFDSRLLDDLFSEHMFAKFQSYRDKVYCSGRWMLRCIFNPEYFDYEYEILLDMEELKKYFTTYEQYILTLPCLLCKTFRFCLGSQSIALFSGW